MAPTPEKALYVGEAGNCLADGTPLIPGETIAEVPKAEAEGSELWQPVKNGKLASGNARNADPDGKPPGAPADPPAEAA
jgi:hypothetical protein